MKIERGPQTAQPGTGGVRRLGIALVTLLALTGTGLTTVAGAASTNLIPARTTYDRVTLTFKGVRHVSTSFTASGTMPSSDLTINGAGRAITHVSAKWTLPIKGRGKNTVTATVQWFGAGDSTFVQLTKDHTTVAYAAAWPHKPYKSGNKVTLPAATHRHGATLTGRVSITIERNVTSPVMKQTPAPTTSPSPTPPSPTPPSPTPPSPTPPSPTPPSPTPPSTSCRSSDYTASFTYPSAGGVPDQVPAGGNITGPHTTDCAVFLWDDTGSDKFADFEHGFEATDAGTWSHPGVCMGDGTSDSVGTTHTLDLYAAGPTETQKFRQLVMNNNANGTSIPDAVFPTDDVTLLAQVTVTITTHVNRSTSPCPSSP